MSEIKAYSKADLVAVFQKITPKGTIISEDTSNNKWEKGWFFFIYFHDSTALQ